MNNRANDLQYNYVAAWHHRCTPIWCTLSDPTSLYFISFLFQPVITGVCGVLTYMLEVDPESEPKSLQMMLSVPYNLNAHGAYFAMS